MEDTLLKSRKEFREEANKYLIKDKTLTENKARHDNFEKLKKLAQIHDKAEHLYRRGFMLSKIETLGLKEYSEKIIDGMNDALNEELMLTRNTINSNEQAINLNLSGSDSSLIYGINYINNWKMYHDLWKDLDEGKIKIEKRSRVLKGLIEG